MERLSRQKGQLMQFARAGQARFQQLLSAEMPAWAFFLDFVIYPPLVVFCLFLGMIWAGIWAAVMAALAGVAFWTLAEYLIHRFAFHHAPGLKPIHMAHHDSPRDLNGTPTLLTVLVFYLCVYLPLDLAFGAGLAAAGTAGVMLGYLAYVTVHYVVHHLGSGGIRPLRRLIKLHALHHHDLDHNFGVTSPFWDLVFGTYARR